MNLSHFHVGVLDLDSAIRQMEEVWSMRPRFQNKGMAVYAVGETTLVLDLSDEETAITLAFESADCDLDYDRVVSKGAITMERPADQPWGVRTAYLKGPGKVTFEIEQTIRK